MDKQWIIFAKHPLLDMYPIEFEGSVPFIAIEQSFFTFYINYWIIVMNPLIIVTMYQSLRCGALLFNNNDKISMDDCWNIWCSHKSVNKL